MRVGNFSMAVISFFILFSVFGLIGSSAKSGEGYTGLFTSLEPIKAHYDIDSKVEFDSSRAVFTGVAEISFTNSSGTALERLALLWEIDSTRTLDLTVNGFEANIISPEYGVVTDDPVVIQLPEKIAPGEEILIKAEFKTVYFIEPDDDYEVWTCWFPRIYWGITTQDDFEVKLENNSDYTVASTGQYDPKTDTYRAVNARRFGFAFRKNTGIMKKTSDGTTVRIIHTPAASECAELVMETALDAIKFYKKRFGFFPSDHIDIVQGADVPMGGYPAATNLVFIHGMERMAEREELHWRWITAHELGHQYWYEYVMSDTRFNMGWLMIGLGIYVDREYCRNSGLAKDQHLGLMSRYINGVRQGLDTRADVYGDYLDDISFDFNNVVVHGKGYSIISALNCVLGDKLFDRIHSRCLREFRGKRMRFCDFQGVCEEESGQDLDWFFDQWVRSDRFSAFEFKAKECSGWNGKFESDIVVERTGTLDMPVPVTAYFADGSAQTGFTGRMQKLSSLKFKSGAKLDSAVIDAGHEIAMVDPAPTAEELAFRRKLASIPPYSVIDSIPQLVEGALAANIDQTLFWGQLGRKLYDWGKYEEASKVFQRRAELLENIESNWVMSAYGWQGLLLDLLGRRDEAVQMYQKALGVKTDQEFSYSGDPVTISREWLEERLKTPFVREE